MRIPVNSNWVYYALSYTELVTGVVYEQGDTRYGYKNLYLDIDSLKDYLRSRCLTEHRKHFTKVPVTIFEVLNSNKNSVKVRTPFRFSVGEHETL